MEQIDHDTFAMLQRSLEPWLGKRLGGDATEVRNVPAADALAALYDAGIEDNETVDGLPGASRFCRLAIELHPRALVWGLLLGPPAERPDARLHLSSMFLPARNLLARDLRPRVAELFGSDEQPNSVTRLDAHAGRWWELFWD